MAILISCGWCNAQWPLWLMFAVGLSCRSLQNVTEHNGDEDDKRVECYELSRTPTCGYVESARSNMASQMIRCMCALQPPCHLTEAFAC